MGSEAAGRFGAPGQRVRSAPILGDGSAGFRSAGGDVGVARPAHDPTESSCGHISFQMTQIGDDSS